MKKLLAHGEQSALARAIGKRPQYVSNILAGHFRVYADVAIALEKASKGKYKVQFWADCYKKNKEEGNESEKSA